MTEKQGNGVWPPFRPGHELSLKHGCYASTMRLGDRARELANEIREVVPARSDADEVAIRALSIVLTRIERAAAVEEPSARLEADLRGWLRLLRSYLGDLGLTPASRARLRLDALLGDRARQQLDAHLDANYGDEIEAEGVEGS